MDSRAKLLKSATKKRDLKKASFTSGRDLRPKAREQNFATESSSLGKSQGYRKEAWLLRWDNESRTIVRLQPMS